MNESEHRLHVILSILAPLSLFLFLSLSPRYAGAVLLASICWSSRGLLCDGSRSVHWVSGREEESVGAATGPDEKEESCAFILLLDQFPVSQAQQRRRGSWLVSPRRATPRPVVPWSLRAQRIGSALSLLGEGRLLTPIGSCTT